MSGKLSITISFVWVVLLACLSLPVYCEENIDPQVLSGSEKTYNVVDIHKKIRQIKPQIDECYVAQVKQSKNPPQGKIKVNFLITSKGNATKISIKSSTLKNKKVENCLMKVISETVFSPSSEDEIIEVNYPFDFRITGKETTINTEIK